MRKSMKLRTTLLMSIALFVSLFVFAVSMQFAPKVNADSTIFTNQQTQIRTKTQENGISGIRFTTTVDLTGSDISSDAEFGLLVAKTADLDGKALNFDLANFDQVATKVPAGVFVTKTETSLVYQVVVAGIPASDYGTSITAVPYVIDGETTIVASSGQDHSIAEVASALIARGDESADKLIGYVDGVTDENSLVVDVESVELEVEDTYNLEVSVTPNYLVPVYASDDVSVATVKDGVITAVGAGTANITVTLGSTVKTVVVNVAEPVVADAEDAEAVKHIYAKGSSKWAGYNTVGEVVEYSSTTLTKPNGVEGESLVKYTLTSTDTHASGKLVNSTPLRYQQGGSYALTAEQVEVNFSKAVLSFWFYNASSVDIKICFADNVDIYHHTVSKAYLTAKAGEWTKAEFALSLTGATKANYHFVISLFTDRIQYEELNYYIDNVTIYEPFIPDAEDTKALVHLHAVGSDRWPGCNTTGEIIEYATLDGISKPDGVTGDSLIKYTFTSAGNWVNSLPLRFTNGAEKAFDEEESKLDFSIAYISFDVYNPNGVDFTAYLAKSANGYFHTTNKVDSVAVKKGEWTKVEFSLASFDITKSYDVAIFMAASITAGAGATYYLDNVTIYEKHPEAPTDKTTLSYAEWAIANNGSYDFNATNIPVDENGVSWLKVDNKDAKITEGKTKLKVTVNFTTFGTMLASSVHDGQNGTYKFSFGFRHGGEYTTWADAQHATYGCIIGTAKDTSTPGAAFKFGFKVYSGSLLVIDHQGGWSYASTTGSGHSGSANKMQLSTDVDYVFEIDVTNNCAGELLLNFGASSIIKGIEWA